MKALNLGHAARVGIAALLVAWLSMRSAQGLPKPAPVPAGADPVANLLSAFAAAASHLPERGHVGYIAESDDLTPYFLAQHALVPIILTRGKEQELVLAYFPSASMDADLARTLELVADVGNGVRIYRRRIQ